MQFKKNGKTQQVKPEDYTTLIDEGSEIEGKFNFNGTVMVNGKLRGEIVANDSLVIGDKGVVNATIRAGAVQILGEVVGDVHATERVELCASCRVYGDVDSPIVVIEEGALFQGTCKMTRARPMEMAQTPTRDLSVVPLKREGAAPR